MPEITEDFDGGPPRGQGSAIIVGGSLVAGPLAAFALVAGPFAGGAEHEITAAILLGFAFAWALLAVASVRWGGRPQRWAAIPAAALAASAAGLLVVQPDADALESIGWVWPALLVALVGWMTVQARRQPRSRARSLLLYPTFGVMALVATGGAYETLSSTDPLRPISGQRLVDVGGHRLSLRCTGSGSPTVVLEPGLGEAASAMSQWITADVASTTTVCVYDRAGHGRSDAAPAEHDGARDLHVLLERAGVPGPYVLAGHSLGGMFALSYADRYPAQVAGVVLLDSMHPTTSGKLGPDPVLAVVPTLARTGLARLLFDEADGDPVAQAGQFARDIAEMPAEIDRAAQVRTLGDKPLGVVSAAEGSASGWHANQVDLAKLSSNSVHRVIAGSTHTSLIDDARDAAQSSRAVRDVVQAARSGARIDSPT